MAPPVALEVDGRQVEVTHPDRVIFPDTRHTKLDLIRYYLAVADGALRGVAGRPMILKRFVKGIEQEAIFQKRAPEKRPDWVDVAELRYASGTSAKEAVIHDAAGLVWAVNMGCVDLNPHPVRADDLAHPDELRVDLDPMPGVQWREIVDVALVAREVLEAAGRRAEDVDWLIPHQANIRIMQGTARKLKLPNERLVVTVDEHGNTSAASIPLALAEASGDGRIKRGDLVLLEAMGGVGQLPPFLAGWAPDIIFFFLGMYFFFKMPT